MKKSNTFAAVNNQLIYKNKSLTNKKNKSLTNKVLSLMSKIYEKNE